ncbi:MAG: hypothetical protein JSW71_00695 [Gemmatimonadota bacterium]|nr:MAG: hypothetical protein JSW71_00695 [Gemmatimonadota bacterium]
MPSDERIQPALTALSGRIEAFRAALATTIEQIRSFQSSHGSTAATKLDRFAEELGPFATDRIDVKKFSGLFADSLKLDTVTLETIDKARATLEELAALEDQLFVLDVPSGGNLRDHVSTALENLGRAFGAARVFELSKFGRFPDNEHARSLGSFPFSRWSRGERRMAPPLVLSVDGSDLRAAGLAEFMDGAQKIVLVVRGEATPVPLVRLITPGAYVLQTTEPSDLNRFAEAEAPGVAALVPESAARFVHDPIAGPDAGARLKITSLPEERRRKPVGGVSVAQQSEELLQLKSLGGQVGVAAPTAEVAVGVPSSSDPVDKLAAWLLNQADLRDLG